MKKPDWYRRTTWTPDDQAAFEAHLKRSRTSFHKAQYLRIQATHLQQVGTDSMLHAAVELLDRMIHDYPEASQLSSAWQQRGQCLVDLGRHDEAIEAFRGALQAQRKAPGWRNEAHLDLGELIVQLRRRELYPEAIRALTEFGGEEVFPVSVYRHAVTRALIADAMGESATARGYAQQALAAAAKDESPFRYHRNLGLVRFVDPDVLAKLRELCAA